MTARVLIVYPEIFACQSKFDRKVSQILSRLTCFEVIHQGDPNGFISAFFAEDERVGALQEVSSLETAQVTHAVVFDDGEEFAELRNDLKQAGIPLRWIKIKITRVINLKREPEFEGMKSTAAYEYIGRGSYWGNPHSMHEEGESREEVIRKYQYDFEYNKFIKIDPTRVHELAGKRLGCFCKPAPCHGDVLADFLNRYDDGE
ncbi:hypothetical protein CFI10_04220 [Marinobacterium iners]|uniref:DUF4326 domain-containing protein n=1 Tax=Marinobacterium iners TaxID=48076 RepID=UPI001A9098EA|nr:DUF4326 domain-containing protein [Marinobacterium iners]QSR34199.1 hypothetical protein CFI10_04220 [Marinobacterium iners]